MFDTTPDNLHPFINALQDPVLIVDSKLKIVLANTGACEMFGYPRGQLVGSDLTLLIPERHREAHETYVQDYLHDPLVRPMGAGGYYTGLLSDGSELPVDIMISPIRLDGRRAALAIVRDISYQRKLEERLLRDSLTDEMTEFYNRKHFQSQLKSQFSNFKRSGMPASLLLFDFDHFKTVNDLFGHAAGDRVLIECSAAIRDSLRPSDIGFRIGGEEFAIILPNTLLTEAVSIGKRLCGLISASKIACEDDELRVSVTVGVATLDASDHSVETLFRRADQALYAGKQTGRNRVVSQDMI
ncbi:sensor domain-containing diguanylate cyclase [Marinobacter sp. LQ44]|uniref:sensor domain-containing diguanylate cyclase n=1 Tax=unclassified Marinobacter TaxID=83889 RepID=UPI000718AE3E|nr:sensor domain-containing diguanylate cyclase [Marinobacter sp. LQ44]AMQ90664.1 hypothetical protein ASQ50_19300 [Marinobacter sp. LQ44]